MPNASREWESVERRQRHIAISAALRPRAQVLYQASIYLEAVAILPQLMLVIRTGNIDNLTGNYIFLLGAYRALYILNWIYRFFTEPKFIHWLSARRRSRAAAAASALPRQRKHCCSRARDAPLEAAELARGARWAARGLSLSALKLMHPCLDWCRVQGEVAMFRCSPTRVRGAVWLSGLVQTGLYADFFYYYFLSWKNNEKLQLPS